MKYVSYTRVSSLKQGESGLGLAAQKNTIDNYVKMNNGEIIGEFTDILSGKNDNRPQLNKAIELAKFHDATLLVSKLDRISRNVAFCFKLLESKVKFQAADIPELNTLTLGIYATLSQYERELISSRTKSALQELKKKGKKLGQVGKLHLTEEGREKSILNRVKAAKENVNNVQIRNIIKTLHKEGKQPTEIATKLNSLHYRTASGKIFKPHSIYYHLTKINEYRL